MNATQRKALVYLLDRVLPPDASRDAYLACGSGERLTAEEVRSFARKISMLEDVE